MIITASRVSVIAIAALMLWSAPVFAQSAGRSPALSPVLTGRVTDPHGAAIGGADVRVQRQDGAAIQRTLTDAAGAFQFAALASGRVVIEIEKQGFRRQVTLLTLADQRPATLDIQLDVAGVDEGVVVTASGLPQATEATSKAITLIDVQEIQARNEASLIEIVRFTPGVQVRDGGGPGQFASMRIRGLRSDAAAVLVDGLRFRDASTTQGDVTSFMSNLNFVSADRVEVLRGSGSSLYGTNAVGGVVNIVSRDGGRPTRGDAQLEAGSLGHVRTRGSIAGGALDDRLAYSAGGLQWNVRDGLDGDDSARSTGGQGMLRYQFSPATSVTARFYGSNDRVALNSSPTASGIPAANVPNAVIVDAIPVSRSEIDRANRGEPYAIGGATYIPGRNDPDNRRKSWFQTTAVQFKQARSARLSWQASYQRVHTTRTFTSGPLGPGFQSPATTLGNYVGDIDTVDARALLQPSTWLSVTAGYELERERYFDRQDNNLPAPSRVQTETGISQIAHAGFAAAQIALLERRLQLSISGRLQGFDLGAVDLSAVGANNPYDDAKVSAPPRAVTGDISAAYLIAASSTKVRAHAGNAYRAPALYERFGGGFSTDPESGRIVFTAYGDPRLEPDRYRSYDVGVDQSLWRDRVQVSATAFYVDVRALTAFDSAGRIRPDSDPFGRSLGYLNGSGGFSRGVELGVDARPTSTLRVSGSYSYTHAESDRDVTVPGFFLVPGVLGHTASFIVSNRWTDRVETTFDLFHGSTQYGAFFAAGRPRAYRYPGFTKAALIGSYRLPVFAGGSRQSLRAYIKIDNLFDETYYQGGWLALGRTAMAGVAVGF